MAQVNKLIKYNGINVKINAFVFDTPITFRNGGAKTASVSFQYGEIWFNHLQVVDNKLKQPLSYQNVKEQATQQYANVLVAVNIIPKELSEAILEAIGQTKAQYDKEAEDVFNEVPEKETPKTQEEP